MFVRILLAVLVLTPIAQAQPADPREFVVGVCTHFSQRKGMLDENLRMIREMGVQSIRDEVPWQQVERVRGEMSIPERHEQMVDHALKLGLEPILVLAYGNPHYQNGRKPTEPESIDGFVRYAEFVVSHFKGRVKRFEVWNEWDIGIGTAGGEAGTPEAYLQLIERVYPALKAIDPTIEVIGGVVSPTGLRTDFFEQLIAGGLARHCDAISVHPYCYGSAEPEHRTPESAIARIVGWRDLIAQKADKPVPIYITEMGWPTHTGPGGTPLPRSADYLARFLLLARATDGVSGVWWYDFQDDGWNHEYNEDNFGLVRPDLTPKPAYYALRQIAATINGASAIERVEAPIEKLQLLRMRSQTGPIVLVLWSTEATVRVSVALTPEPQAEATASVTVIGRAPLERRIIHREWPGQPQAPLERRLAVTVGPSPVLIELPSGHDLQAIHRAD